jgi:hypothetical protein
VTGRARTLAGWAAAWAVAVGLLVAALERPAPLLLNLGAGDDAFARGFRGGWERDGLQGSGETMFRWTTDGSRLEWPVLVASGHARVRLRLARFAPGSATIRLHAGDRLVEEWTQPSRGWSLKTIDLGEPRGALRLQFRSSAVGQKEDELGVALDWVEARDVGRVWPAPRLAPGLIAFLLGVPLLVCAVHGSRAAFGAHVALLLLAAVAIFMDRLGGLVAASACGFPALLISAGMLVTARLLGRRWPEVRQLRALAIPGIALAIFLLALFHPFFYYPDVDTHARFVAALQSEPRLALDPSPYQARTGAWTRTVAGRLLPFPYSPVFHLLALPLAWPLGAVAAVKTLALAAVALSLLLVLILARAVGWQGPTAILAQAVFALLPVTSSRLCLALYPALLGQALEMAVLLGLAVLYPRLPERRAWLVLWALLILAGTAYTGSILNLSAFVLVFVSIEAARGERRRALSVALAWALATLLVGAALYASFLPSLLGDVLPHATGAPAGESSIVVDAFRRFLIFYGPLLPLSVVGFGWPPSRDTAWRALVAALATGLCLLLLRFVFPTLLRDVKEVELLAAPAAVGAGALLARLWSRGGFARAMAGVLGLGVAFWGCAKAAGAYGARFLAVALDSPW